MPHLHSYKPNIRISASSLFRFLQIRDFVKKNLISVLNKHDTLEAVNKLDPGSRGAISVFYRMLHDGALMNTEVYKRVWVDELNTELKDEI